MKIIKLNGLKPEITNLDYNTLNEEMKRCDKKGKIEKVNTYSKLLKKLKENSSSEDIEEEINKIIDTNKEEVKELKRKIKILEKEISLLSNFSERETEEDVLPTIIANL